MNEEKIYYVEGTPVNTIVNDAEVLPDIPLGRYRNTILEDCPGSGMFIEKDMCNLFGVLFAKIL